MALLCIGEWCLSWTYLRFAILANYWPEFSILALAGLVLGLVFVRRIAEKKHG